MEPEIQMLLCKIFIQHLVQAESDAMQAFKHILTLPFVRYMAVFEEVSQINVSPPLILTNYIISITFIIVYCMTLFCAACIF